jgi:hypothetical protein
MKNAKPKSITYKQQTTSKIEKKEWRSYSSLQAP